MAVPAQLLGPVHGGIGVADQHLRAGGGVVGDHRTDAHRDHHLLVEPDRERRRQQLTEPRRNHAGTDRIGKIRADHDELVAAETGEGVTGAHAVAKPHGDLGEKIVSSGVAEPVVDRFELIEIAEQQRHPTFARHGALQRLGQPLVGQ